MVLLKVPVYLAMYGIVYACSNYRSILIFPRPLCCVCDFLQVVELRTFQPSQPDIWLKSCFVGYKIIKVTKQKSTYFFEAECYSSACSQLVQIVGQLLSITSGTQLRRDRQLDNSCLRSLTLERWGSRTRLHHSHSVLGCLKDYS